jgi:integrase
MRHHHCAYRTEKTYSDWIRRYIRHFCAKFHPTFATHLLENGVNIRVVQELMGHADVKTTEIYTQVMEKDLTAVASPLDNLQS